MKSLLIVALGACAGVSFAQTSNYFITCGSATNGVTFNMQGGAQQGSFAWAADAQMPIVVGNFGAGVRIRQAAGQPLSGNPQQGDEYLLDGTATGTTNFWNSGAPSRVTAYDAAFDGNNIYMVLWYPGTVGRVFRYDNNYANGTLMFQTHVNDLGITHDSLTNTLWFSNWDTGRVSQYSMAGTELFSFQAAGENVGALAYDAADDTLWMAITSTGQLAQYSRTGSLLQSYNAPALILGGEMAAAVPEPATLAAMAAGLAFMALRQRKSQNR